MSYLAIAAALSLTACSSHPAAPQSSSTTAAPSLATALPSPSPSSTSLVDTAALSATRAWLSYDTVIDQRPNDTAKRSALAWLSPTLARQVTAYTSATSPDAQWQEWRRHQAHATVTAEIGGDEHPPDTSQDAWRQVHATVTLHGRDGWISTVQVIDFVHLRLIAGRWLVADLTTAPT